MVKDILAQIEEWNGETSTKLGMLLRTKTYSCFNSLIERLGKDISSAIDNQQVKDDKTKLKIIRTILAKHNLYTTNGK